RATIPASQTRDAWRLFRIRKGLSRKLVNPACGIAQESWISACQYRSWPESVSVALLALVLIAVLLDARDAQSGHPAAVHRTLPTGELLEAERITRTGIIDAEQAARDRGYDFGLAAHDPAGRGGRRQ